MHIEVDVKMEPLAIREVAGSGYEHTARNGDGLL